MLDEMSQPHHRLQHTDLITDGSCRSPIWTAWITQQIRKNDWIEKRQLDANDTVFLNTLAQRVFSSMYAPSERTRNMPQWRGAQGHHLCFTSTQGMF